MKKIYSLILFFSFSFNSFSQWYKNETPIGDPITDIYFVNNSIGFATTSAGVVLKTTDGGANWMEKTIEATYLTSLYFLDEQTGFVITTSLSSDRLFYKTTDGGENWTKLTSILPNPRGGNQILFTNSQTGYIVGAFDTISYLLKSTDGGSSWTSKGNFTHPLTSVYFIDQQIGFVGDRRGKIFKTSDAGENWQLIFTPLTHDVIQAFSFPSSQTGFALGETNGHVFKTIDGGLNWTETNQIYPSSLGTDMLFTNTSNGFITCFDYNSPYDMLKTTDGGLNWTFDQSYLKSYRGGCISSRPDGVLFIGTLEGKILSSQLLTGVKEENPYSIKIYPNPSSGVMKIEDINSNFMDGKLEVFDISGRLVFEDKIEATDLSVNTFLKMGIYQVRLTSLNRENYTIKWVVQ